jgi:hypothetical protein
LPVKLILRGFGRSAVRRDIRWHQPLGFMWRSAMSKLLSLTLALALGAVHAVAQAGVAPSHDTSQLGQSGAKIAPPKKAEEEQKKPAEPSQSNEEKR